MIIGNGKLINHDYIVLIIQIGEQIRNNLKECFDFGEIEINEYVEDFKHYNQKFTLDFNRPSICSQVMDNKPKHLVKKVRM